jgi:hypothetical protein
MLASLLILLAMPLLDTSRVRGSQFRPLMRFAFWVFVTDFFLLMYLGSQHAEEPYITVGAFATVFYFAWFVVIVPMVGIVENTMMDIATDKTTTQSPLPSTTQTPSKMPTGKRGYSTLAGPGPAKGIEEAQASVKAAIKGFNSSTLLGSPEEFREVVNGFHFFFQKKKSRRNYHIFRGLSGLKLYPYMNMVQLYSAESLDFFVRTYFSLGCVGRISIHLNDQGKLMISYRIIGWDKFLNVFMPYFDMLYGLKHLAILKMVRIHELVHILGWGEHTLAQLNAFKLELVSLVYSVAPITASLVFHHSKKNYRLTALTIPHLLYHFQPQKIMCLHSFGS